MSFARTFPRGLTLSEAERVHVTAPRGNSLVKQHECAVTFPDGSRGTCCYERLGPAYHRFDYRYGDGAPLPRQWWTKPLSNTIASIEAAAQARADAAFTAAIESERRDRFARVSEPTDGSRKKRPELYRMDAKTAKAQGGKYALCQPLGNHLLATSRLFDKIGEANDAWKQAGNPALVVACCNRLDRRWEVPKYNPLHQEHDFRHTTQTAKGEAEDATSVISSR
jgi:hypothetical protein